MFRVGQKVVCVRPDALGILVARRVYTISHFSYGYDNGPLALHLCEVSTGHYRPRGLGERGFAPDRFRPVVEKKTDTGFAILEEIRRRETIDERQKIPAR